MSNWYDDLPDARVVSETNAKTNQIPKNRSAGKYAVDLARAGTQGASFAYGDEMEAGARALYQKFVDGKDFGTAYGETLKEIRGEISSFRDDNPVLAYGTEIAGNLAVTRGRGGIPSAMKQGFIYGTGTSDGDAGDRLTSGATSSALSGILSKVAPYATKEAKELIKRGVNLTVGQATSGKGSSPIGSGVKMFEEGMMSFPFIGSPIRKAYKRTAEELNKASYNQILEPLKKWGVDPKKVTKSEAGNELYTSAKNVISDQYNKLLPKLKFPNVSELQSVYDDVILRELDNLPKDVQNRFLNDMDNHLYANFNKEGILTGEGFKKVQSNLRGLAKGYLTSSDQTVRNIGGSYKKILDTLNGTLVKMNPKHAQQLSDIDFSFKMLIPLEKATVSASANSGVFSPSQLMNAVKSSDKSLRKTNVASGDALLQDIAGLGQNIKINLPNSGTATRADIMKTMGGLGGDAVAGYGAMSNPLLAGGLATGTILGYSRGGTPIFRRAVTDVLAPAMDKTSGVVGGLLGNEVAEQTNNFGMNRR